MSNKTPEPTTHNVKKMRNPNYRPPLTGATFPLTTDGIAQFMWERAGEGAVVDQQYQWLGKYVLAVMVPHYVHSQFKPFTVQQVADITGMPAAKAGWILNELTQEGHLRRRVRKVPGETYGVSYYVYSRNAPVIDVDDETQAWMSA